VLSTNVDRAGTAFLSTVEAYKYPVYATQWHPEKNLYEWQKVDGVPAEAINHGPDAMDISRYVSHFWVQEARKSNHRFADAATEESSLIYNYPKVATTGSFVETYVFCSMLPSSFSCLCMMSLCLSLDNLLLPACIL
jgi:gamma-glutamyl hydrolase